MNMESYHEFVDRVAYYQQCVRKARRLRNICRAHTRRMYCSAASRNSNINDIPPFMQVWWTLVGDIRTCAVMLEGNNNAPFLNLLSRYRKQAQIEFKTVRS